VFVLVLGVVVAGAAAYRFYLRDSSLVAVKHVRVEGINPHSPDAGALETDIERAAKGMTTLHVRPELLQAAVKDHPLVRSVSASASFPHSLTVSVVERKPAAYVGAGSAKEIVADDGVILTGVGDAKLHLPHLTGIDAPGKARVSGHALQEAQVVGAAPHALVRFLDTADFSSNGVVVYLTDGIELRFGSASFAKEKWNAAAGVLADPGLTALDYVDLSAPNRPAVGGAGHLLPATW
jgi:cell division protein FtsQ